MLTQAHILSFEGPDAYARAGGIASRIIGLAPALADQDLETHLWCVGDPHKAGNEASGNFHHHRWCQWLSAMYPSGVYDGEEAKAHEYATSLPPHLMDHHLSGLVERGGRAIILAEEWHTVHAVLHLDWLLRRRGLRDRVAIFWNANNTFGFDQIPWARLAEAAVITTVSRYMRHLMANMGVTAYVIPNGLGADAFVAPDPETVRAVSDRIPDRVVLSKVARWDRDKGWIATLDIIKLLRERGMRPLLVARGGVEAYGGEVLAAANRRGLRISSRQIGPGRQGLHNALSDLDAVDIVNLTSSLDSTNRATLFQASHVVLANSAHEPFGLVGLEAMAVGAIACTGSTGEDYAIAGRNAIVLQTPDPNEFATQFTRVASNPGAARELRAEARSTARRYGWAEVLRRNLLPQVDVVFDRQALP